MSRVLSNAIRDGTACVAVFALGLFSGCMTSTVACTFKSCSDRFAIVVLQDEAVATASGVYTLVVSGNGVSTTCEATVESEHGPQCSGTRASCDAEGHLQFNLVGVFRPDSLPAELAIEVRVGATPVLDTTITPRYEWTWCNGPDDEACNDRKNYATDVRLTVAYPPTPR